MNIGDYVTTLEIASQSNLRWVVLTNLRIDDEGDIEGGVINFIADTRVEAAERSVSLDLNGETTLLVSGAIEPLSVGGVLVYESVE